MFLDNGLRSERGWRRLAVGRRKTAPFGECAFQRAIRTANPGFSIMDLVTPPKIRSRSRE